MLCFLLYVCLFVFWFVHFFFGRIPWRRERLPTPVFWPGEFHGLYSPWGHKESDTTEGLSLSLFFFFLISYFYLFIFSALFIFYSWDSNFIYAIKFDIIALLYLCKLCAPTFFSFFIFIPFSAPIWIIYIVLSLSQRSFSIIVSSLLKNSFKDFFILFTKFCLKDMFCFSFLKFPTFELQLFHCILHSYVSPLSVFGNLLNSLTGFFLPAGRNASVFFHCQGSISVHALSCLGFPYIARKFVVSWTP